MSNRSRNALFVAILVLGSTLTAVLLAELGFRTWKASELQPDPYVIRSLVPNTRRQVFGLDTPENNSGRSTSIPEEPVLMGWTSTNNLGFRMSEDVGRKGPDERRILLLGDSYLEGAQLDASERFSEIVSGRVDEEHHGRWKVVNAGIRSGSPLQYLMQLHQWGDELQPDLVVVLVGPNDSPDDIRSKRRYGVVVDDDGFPIGPEKFLSLALVQKSHLARYLTRLTLFRMPDLFALLSPDRGPDEEAARGSVHSWIELACAASEHAQDVFLEGTGLYLRMLRDVVGGLGADFAVLSIHYPFYFPDEPTYEGRFPPDFWEAIEKHGCVQSWGRAYETFLRDFLRTNGIEFASTYDRFVEAKKRNPRQKLWHFYDYHYNSHGHQLVADDLHELIEAMIEARGS